MTHASAMTILAVSGELDLAGAEVVLAYVDQALLHRPLVIAVDLRDLAFMDARGVQALVRAGERCQAGGRRFTVIRGGRHIDTLLEACGLSGYFDMVAELDQLPDGKLTISGGL